MAVYINPPCKDCPDRHLKCHSTCEKYLEFKSINEKYKEQEHYETILKSIEIDRARRVKALISKSRRGK